MPPAVETIGIPVVNGIDALKHIRALDPTPCPPVPVESGTSGLPRPVDVRYVGDAAIEPAVLALGT